MNSRISRNVPDTAHKPELRIKCLLTDSDQSTKLMIGMENISPTEGIFS